MFTTETLFHPLKVDHEAPSAFTYPFSYVPHPWVVKAADELKAYLTTQTDFEYSYGHDEASVGKMFGVLVVENSEQEIGYLAAFSGKINESNQLKGFVPPVFDVLDPQGFFKIGENELNELNKRIRTLTESEEGLNLKSKLDKAKSNYNAELSVLKKQLKAAKKQRHLKRKQLAENQENSAVEVYLEKLNQQSQQDHFTLKDFKRKGKANIAQAEKDWYDFQTKIDQLKNQRKQKSAELQAQIHQSFQFLNAHSKEATLLSIFAPYDRVPPAGAGECAAPRLLQYAFEHNLKPLAMGEFWWGKAPKDMVRQQGEFYPACKSKCEPILNHMLQGLKVEDNPVYQSIDYTLDIIYEDEFLLLVNKPAGVLSVPGKTIKECLAQKVEDYLGSGSSPMLVHRLDMATSGLVLVAKNLEIYKQLQTQFTQRSVQKTYTAILDGIIPNDSGKIDLPLRVDLDNRPMQLVCEAYGKQAITYYQVIARENSKTRILFYPWTGRTHQLRVHAAHHRGLGVSILGDVLYGKSQDRLYLHATTLEFDHPITDKRMKFTATPSF